MSQQFIYAGGRYINLSQIEQVKIKGDGRWELVKDNRILDDNNASFGTIITTVLTPQGEWECLSLVSEDDGSDGVWAEPILAWGLTSLGQLTPITPSSLSGVDGYFALRQKGSPTVYTAETSYDDETAWKARGGFK